MRSLAAVSVGGDDKKHSRALAIDAQQDLSFRAGCETVEVLDIAHRLPVDAFNNIALLEILGRRAVEVHFRDGDSSNAAGHAQLIAKGRGQVLDRNW